MGCFCTSWYSLQNHFTASSFIRRFHVRGLFRRRCELYPYPLQLQSMYEETKTDKTFLPLKIHLQARPGSGTSRLYLVAPLIYWFSVALLKEIKTRHERWRDAIENISVSKCGSLLSNATTKPPKREFSPKFGVKIRHVRRWRLFSTIENPWIFYKYINSMLVQTIHRCEPDTKISSLDCAPNLLFYFWIVVSDYISPLFCF